MRRPLRRLLTSAATVLILAAGLVVGAGAGPALATHEDDCPAYTSDLSARDEALAELVVQGVEFEADAVKAGLDDAEEPSHSGTPADPIVYAAVEAGRAIAIPIAGTVVFAAKMALTVLQGINADADECRISAHWELEDQLLKSAVKRDLVSTATPVLAFVLPEEHGGYIDKPEVGVQAVVTEELAQMKADHQCTCSSAQSYLNTADSQLAARNYKTAYKYYRQAYVATFSG